MAITAEELAAELAKRKPHTASTSRSSVTATRTGRPGTRIHRRAARPATRDRARRRGSADPRGGASLVPGRLRARGGRRPSAGEGDPGEGAGDLRLGYTKLNIQEVEGAGPGGAFHFVRRELGVLAFGVNWIDLPPDSEGHEHDETNSGQEEVAVVVTGSGTYRVDGETCQSAPATSSASIPRRPAARSRGQRD